MDSKKPSPLDISAPPKQVWIASDPSDYNGIFPHSPSASEGLWDDTILPQTNKLDFGGSVTHCFSNSESQTDKADTQRQTQGRFRRRVLGNISPRNLQQVDCTILKRCDSVARRSKAYETSARQKLEHNLLD